MKKLPIGIQSFAKLIEDGYMYVDKTEYCYRLITGGNYYFLSRPRRFGKSLLLSTLKEIFLGNRDLFEGLWIHAHTSAEGVESNPIAPGRNWGWWEPRPVIHLDFSLIMSIETPLAANLEMRMDEIAAEHGLAPLAGDYAQKFNALIRQLGAKRKVAILVDEYDKPIIHYIDEPEMAERNRAVLKNFYSVLKGNDENIQFLLLTGVTKFTQFSIASSSLSTGFSDLNHLEDISLSREYSQMIGLTHEEILRYFPEELAALRSRLGHIHPDVMAEIKSWYNGYSWDGEHLVYNPFSMLHLLKQQQFRGYWYATGTPTFLMKLIRSRTYSIMELDGCEILLDMLGKFDLPDLQLEPLLFQTGYLTIKKWDELRQVVTLAFPNREVANAFSSNLLAEFSEKGEQQSSMLIIRMAKQLREGNTDEFIQSLTTLFDGIGYPIQPTGKSGIENHEKYYHTMFYLVLRMLGYDIETEVRTSRGSIDAVITTERYRYVVEFKLSDAVTAMAQIKAKGYHQKYLGAGKQVILLGIGFDTVQRNIAGYLVEEAG